MLKRFFCANQALKASHSLKIRALSVHDNDSKDLARKFVRAFRYTLRRTTMDIDAKMKELIDLFAKTGKELGEIVQKNEKFVTDEIQRVETAVRETSEACSKDQLNRLQNVKSTYEERIKTCNDIAAAGFRTTKTKYEEQIRNLGSLKSTMKAIMKECLDANDFAKCMSTKTKEAVERRKEMSKSLNDTVKSADESITGQLKEAVKCHGDAQREVLDSLQKILKDTKDCLQ